mgnify:CR=1 FL=1
MADNFLNRLARNPYAPIDAAALISISLVITFRLNDGNVKRHTMERLESFVSGTKGKRLTYKGLIQ